MTSTKSILCTLALTALLPLVAQADSDKGKALHTQHCIACHTSMSGGDGSALYTRPNRRVTTLAGLGAQVRRCRDNLGLTWFDDQVQDVVEYLNAQHYKFPK